MVNNPIRVVEESFASLYKDYSTEYRSYLVKNLSSGDGSPLKSQLIIDPLSLPTIYINADIGDEIIPEYIHALANLVMYLDGTGKGRASHDSFIDVVEKITGEYYKFQGITQHIIYQNRVAAHKRRIELDTQKKSEVTAYLGFDE